MFILLHAGSSFSLEIISIRTEFNSRKISWGHQHVLHMKAGPHLSASISQTPWGYKFRGTTWTTMGTSAGFCSMKTLIEEFPTWVRGNWTGLSKVKLGHESLASAGIWKPLTTSVSTVNETLTLQSKQNKKTTKWINKKYNIHCIHNYNIHAAVEVVLLTSQP